MKPGRGLRVYVAGPVNGSGKQNDNARRAIQAGDRLMEAGFVPYVPHLTWLWAFMSEKSEEQWLEHCFSWVAACDILVRLPGVSPGSDREVALAKQLGIPVFLGVDELLSTSARWIPPPRPPMPVALPEQHEEIEELHLERSVYPALDFFQEDARRWLARQPFAEQKKHQPLLGLSEELGELSHAHLKNEQNIRGFGDEDKAREAKEDAIGDIFVYAAGYAVANGLNLGECLRRAWAEVRLRDWKKFPKDGRTE